MGLLDTGIADGPWCSHLQIVKEKTFLESRKTVREAEIWTQQPNVQVGTV